ncbi:MAG: cytidylate kinase-like family protein [Bacteroidales bacterium]|nr:cytidylate kinase-like family protein [Bacteroidales bacterium]
MNTNNPFVITISREVGSGGHTVGAILAERLGARYCDKFLLEALEKKFNLSADEIERLKGEKKGWLADIVSKVSPMPTMDALGFNSRYSKEIGSAVTTDDLFKAEVEILRSFAAIGSCVVAGRSGFYVFKNHPNKLNVFIAASMQHRIQRVMSRQGISEAEAAEIINKLDSARENYVKRYAGVSRYDLRNYDVVLNADDHSEDALADIIMSYISR